MSTIIFTNLCCLNLNFPFNCSSVRVTPRFFNSACNPDHISHPKYQANFVFVFFELAVVCFTFVVPVTSGSTVIYVAVVSWSVLLTFLTCFFIATVFVSSSSDDTTDAAEAEAEDHGGSGAGLVLGDVFGIGFGLLFGFVCISLLGLSSTILCFWDGFDVT